MKWEDLPDIDDVKAALVQLAESKSKLRIAELELEIAQADIAKVVPRNSAARIVGIDEESRELLHEIQLRVLRYKAEVEAAEVEVEFNKYRVNCAKTLSFKRGF